MIPMNTDNQSPTNPASTNLAPVYLDNKPITIKRDGGGRLKLPGL